MSSMSFGPDTTTLPRETLGQIETHLSRGDRRAAFAAQQPRRRSPLCGSKFVTITLFPRNENGKKGNCCWLLPTTRGPMEEKRASPESGPVCREGTNKEDGGRAEMGSPLGGWPSYNPHNFSQLVPADPSAQPSVGQQLALPGDLASSIIAVLLGSVLPDELTQA